MLKKRIIPCLDIKDGRTVKGLNFKNMQDAGDPVALAKKYADEGADELVFLDITATDEKRKTLISLVTEIAKKIYIPFTVGGGIQSVADAVSLVNAGADKVSINSSAVKNPSLVKDIARQLGSQAVVIAIDTKMENNNWMVYVNGGKVLTTIATIDWAKLAVAYGAGEILLTSIDNDGTKNGYNLALINEVCRVVNVPLIASGGAGTTTHFKDVFTNTKATGALAASIFHYNEISIPDLKKYLSKEHINIR